MMQFWDMFEAMYLPQDAMRDFGREYRAIGHAQIEMLAAQGRRPQPVPLLNGQPSGPAPGERQAQRHGLRLRGHRATAAAGSGVAHEAESLAFADAALVGPSVLDDARRRWWPASGSEAMTDAAAVIAGFDAITRVADGSGIPLEQPKAEATAGWRASLGIDAFWSMKV